MNHFPIVQALCRTAIADSSPATRKQIERLRDALAKDGEATQSKALTNILSAANRTKEIAPAKIVRSKAQLSGEVLTRNTQVPVDRETAAVLADIIFPAENQPTSPLFNSTVSNAVETIIEEWANIDALSKIGIQPSKTCLIFGAPGTGKTQLALWIAHTLDLPVVLVRLDGLVSSFLGTTARNIGNLFSFANRYRCILLLDEFDAIAKVRDDPQEVGEIKRVVNALLQNLDTRPKFGLTIGITNHSGLLDPAVWRRFEIQLEVPKPDFEVRKSIAAHFMPPVKVSDRYLRLMAWFTEGSTGADIESLVRTYKKATIVGEVKQRVLLESLQLFATLNAARIQTERREQLLGDVGNLFRAMHDDPLLKFSMTDIAKITGRNKSTISRQLGGTSKSNNKDSVE